MQITIPRRLVRTWDAFCVWGDPAVWQRGRLEVRRIDLLLVACFVLATSYYGYFAGWHGAVNGGLMFGFIAIGALLFRPQARE
jgi:hypothetical protein